MTPSLLLVLLLAAPALLSSSIQVGGQRSVRAAGHDSIKVLISDGCASTDSGVEGKEVELSSGSPLVLTHRIKLVPPGSGSGSCGCEQEFGSLQERVEMLEKEVSALREKCGGAEGCCCTSKESKGREPSIKPEVDGCPDDCHDRGSCVNGRCVCHSGYTGPSCSEETCPGECSDHGRCSHGKCVCDSGFAGDDCSESSCLGNCNDRGRCVDGQCVCDPGFTGADCSDRACPNNCSNRGLCVKGKCVCNEGFAGPGCKAKSCPKNCNSRGRCIKGRCVCQSGFAGPDCSQCEDGLTGPNCDAAMSGVSELSVQDVKETSVTLVWTPPPIQYESYQLTFTSQKENDPQISVQVDGGLTSFTQTGLAAGQEYTVSLSGEVGGRRGAASTAEFVTLISGPTNLQVVKTTATSAVVQWDHSQAEIDRYRLTVKFNSTAGEVQDLTLPAGQSSAHIQQLEPGLLYDIVLVAEKGRHQSEPATTQVTPESFPTATMATLNVQVTAEAGPDVSNKDESEPSPEDRRGTHGPNGDSAASVITSGKPLVNRKKVADCTGQKLVGRPSSCRPTFLRPWRFNTPRRLPGAKKSGQGPKEPNVGEKTASTVPEKPKLDVFTIGGGTVASTTSDPSVRASSNERKDPTKTSESRTEADTENQMSPEEPTVDAGSRDLPDVDMAASGSDSIPDSSQPTRGLQGKEKKCMNKIKVTHLKFPRKDRGSGCQEDGTVLPGTKPGSSQMDDSPDLKPSTPETDPDYPSDPLHELLTDTLKRLDIRTFSVHLSQPSDLLSDPSTAGPATSLTSSPSSSPSSVPSLASPSLLSSPPPLSPTPSSSYQPIHSGPDKSSLVRRNESDIDKNKSIVSPGDRNIPSSDKGAMFFRRTSKRRPRPNLLQNKNHPNFKAPRRFPQSNLSAGRDPENRYVSAGGLLSSPSSSTSEDSSPVEANEPVNNSKGDKDEATAVSSEVGQNEGEPGGSVPLRPPLKRGFLRGPLQNRSRPLLKQLPAPFKPLNNAAGAKKEQVPSTELPPTSSPSFPQRPRPANGTGSKEEENGDTAGTNMSPQSSPTLRGDGQPSLHMPTSKFRHFRQPRIYDGRFQNRSRTNLRAPQRPHGGYVRTPLTARGPNGGAGNVVRSQSSRLEKDNQSREQSNAEVLPHDLTEGRDSSVRQQTNTLEEENSVPFQTIQSAGEEIPTSASISDFDIHQSTTKQAFSGSRHGTLPKRQPTAKSTKMNQNIRGSRWRDHENTNNTAKRLLENKKSANSKPLIKDASSSGIKREFLDNVRVTNQSPNGFVLAWDSPQGKYKHFVVTRKEVGSDERPQLEGSQNPPREAPTTGSQPQTEALSENRILEGVSKEDAPKIPDGRRAEPAAGSDKSFEGVLPGSARSFRFESLRPQTEHTVTLLGKGPGLLSRLHKLVVSTGPAAPTNIVFSNVTENSLTVSWTKPKSPVSGFKVTYTNPEDGEPVSVSVGPDDSTFTLSRLTPGSFYEVNVISIVELDESDPVSDTVGTLPDPPLDLQALSVTDSTALLMWRGALAAVDNYTIVYGSGTGSERRVMVSGTEEEHRLTGLEGSTTYTVTITSQLGDLESSPATATFTTTATIATTDTFSGSGLSSDQDWEGELQVSKVTPRTALLSWKPVTEATDGYRLTYQDDNQEIKEVIVGATVTEYNLTRLHPGSTYTVHLQAGGGGEYTAPISTEFTTGTLRFSFPTDCSQELLNGATRSGEVDVYPQGRLGTPLRVYCDMETDGGGWTVFQRRMDGSVDFFRRWKDYVAGFGNLSGEFWMGLDNLQNLTTMTKMILRVDLRDRDERVFAKYSTFEIGKTNYMLTVGGYSGTAGDSLGYHNKGLFSTKDRDLTQSIMRCAMSYRGGWWYKNCHEANLNGLYGIDVKHQGVIWTTWKGTHYSIAFTEMKMRPAAFSPASSG